MVALLLVLWLGRYGAAAAGAIGASVAVLGLAAAVGRYGLPRRRRRDRPG
jgi:hypothetical protein